MQPAPVDRAEQVARWLLWGSIVICIAELIAGLWWIGLLRIGGVGAWPW